MKVLYISFLVGCLVGVLSLFGCSSSKPSASEQTASEGPAYAIQLFVDCEKNLVFSKYDVDVMVDGEAVGNVEHGGEATFGLNLTKGQHELVFRKECASEPDGKTSFVVENEGDKFSYKISCTNDQIDVKSIKEEAEQQSDSKSKEEEDADKQKSTKNDTTKEEASVKEVSATKADEPTKDDKSNETTSSIAKQEADATPKQEPEPSKYEYAYVRRMSNYDIYYLIDLDEMTATNFTTIDGPMVLLCTGDLENGLTVNYVNDGFQEHLKYKTPGSDKVLVLIDANGFDWEYTKANVKEAEAALAKVS
jgi:hypothetical protein